MTGSFCIVLMPYFLTTKIRETNQIITGLESSVTAATVMNGVSYFPPPFVPSLCKITYSAERPEDSDVMKAKIYAFLTSRTTKMRLPCCFPDAARLRNRSCPLDRLLIKNCTNVHVLNSQNV